MYKRILRSISALLVLIMVAELLPTTLLGNMVQRVHAAETIEPTETYSFEAPQETNNSQACSVPPTVSVGAVPEADVSDGVSVSDTIQMIFPEIQSSNEVDDTLPTIDDFDFSEEELEQGRRFMYIIQTYSTYSQLSEEDAAFIAAYFGVDRETMAELSAAGYSISQSTIYVNLAKEIGCTISSVVELAPSEDAYKEILLQAKTYNQSGFPDMLSNEENSQIRNAILNGITFQQICNAYAVNQKTGIQICDLLNLDSEAEVSISSNSEVTAINALASELELSGQALQQYAVQNNLNTDELENLLADVSSDVTLQSTEGSSTPAETRNVFDLTLGAPTCYHAADSERVSLNSGSLLYTATDYTLPGVNGLDLVIGRHYNSQQANVYNPVGEIYTGISSCYYVVTYGADAYYYRDGYGSGRWPQYDVAAKTVEYASEEDAVAYAERWIARSYSVPNFDGDGTTLIMQCYASVTRVVTGTYTNYISRTEVNRSTNGMFSIGQGWSLNFSYIEGNYLYLSNGSAYEIDIRSGNPSGLKEAEGTGLKLERSSSTNNSYYTLSYKDGRREIFSKAGKLTAIKDRYNNTISFAYSDTGTSEIVTITDTLGQITTIGTQTADTGKTVVVVTLPDGNTLRYTLYSDANATKDRPVLEAYTDAAGNTTQYCYTLESGGFNVFNTSPWKATNYYLNLTTIVHPTGAQSVYTYEKVIRNLGSDGRIEGYRIASRVDQVGNTEYNHTSYTYSENNNSGYPTGKAADQLPDTFTYTTTISDSLGCSTTVTFNNKHLQTDMVVKQGSITLQQASYQYDANKLPIETRTKYYSSNTNSYLESVTARTYDSQGTPTTPQATGARWHSRVRKPTPPSTPTTPTTGC